LAPPLPDPGAPSAPAVVGPVAVTGKVEGAVAGTAATLVLAAKDLAGNPYQHSELDVEVRDAKGATLLWTKLHTHGDGLFPLTLAFPAAGDYTLRVAPNALDGAPASYLDGSAATAIAVKVGAGPGLPSLPLVPTLSDTTHAAPGAGLPLLAGLLGLAVLLRRR
ncbi:MAG: hypothetical protein LC620_02925, partial [Halobacteriales archaeon]|nr:hypothetical protein [Halobacteriales archaeon]